jgi:hypothetical protein
LPFHSVFVVWSIMVSISKFHHLKSKQIPTPLPRSEQFFQ